MEDSTIYLAITSFGESNLDDAKTNLTRSDLAALRQTSTVFSTFISRAFAWDMPSMISERCNASASFSNCSENSLSFDLSGLKASSLPATTLELSGCICCFNALMIASTSATSAGMLSSALPSNLDLTKHKK